MKQIKTRFLKLRLTEELYAAVAKSAKHDNRTVSDAARLMLVRALADGRKK